MTTKKIPNFLIIGAAKAGTTSLYNYLKDHPQIYMPQNKEPNYFAFLNNAPDPNGFGNKQRLKEFIYKYAVLNKSDYLNLFTDVNDEIAIGEASTRYLYFQNARDNIFDWNPDIKLIVVLRNPIDRAYSHYKMMVQHKLEPESFEKAIALEESRIKLDWAWDWHYRQLGLYHKQLCYFLQKFSRNQIKIVLYEDLVSDTESILIEIFAFLGVQEISTRKEYEVFNKSNVLPRNKSLDKLLNYRQGNRGIFLPKSIKGPIKNFLLLMNKGSHDKMSVNMRSKLLRFFKDDINGLKEDFNLDLSKWK